MIVPILALVGRSHVQVPKFRNDVHDNGVSWRVDARADSVGPVDDGKDHRRGREDPALSFLKGSVSDGTPYGVRLCFRREQDDPVPPGLQSSVSDGTPCGAGFGGRGGQE